MKSAKPLFMTLFLALALTANAAAQSMPGDYLMMYTIKVRPGANAQFEDYLKKIQEGADKTNAPQMWGAGQITAGGPGSTYMIGLQMNKLGEMDGWNAVPAILTEAFGEEEGAKILRSGLSSVESSSTTVYRTKATTLSRWRSRRCTRFASRTFAATCGTTTSPLSPW